MIFIVLLSLLPPLYVSGRMLVQITESKGLRLSDARSQCLRTLLDHVFAFELRDPPETPVYQRIAAQAAEMRAGGAAFHAIAEHFGVDDHTAADAVRWFHGEL